eukprot:363257-Chlamydomonas_euryale.AAC.10
MVDSLLYTGTAKATSRLCSSRSQFQNQPCKQHALALAWPCGGSQGRGTARGAACCRKNALEKLRFKDKRPEGGDWSAGTISTTRGLWQDMRHMLTVVYIPDRCSRAPASTCENTDSLRPPHWAGGHVLLCWRKTPDLGAPTSSYTWTSPDQALEPGGEFCVPTSCTEPQAAGV